MSTPNQNRCIGSAGSREALRMYSPDRFSRLSALYPLVEFEREAPLGAPVGTDQPNWTPEHCLQLIRFERDGILASKLEADKIAKTCFRKQNRAHGFRLVGTLLLAAANIATFITVSETSGIAFIASLSALIGSICLVCFEIYSAQGGGTRTTGELLAHLDRAEALLRRIDRWELLASSSEMTLTARDALQIQEDSEVLLADLLRLISRLDTSEK